MNTSNNYAQEYANGLSGIQFESAIEVEDAIVITFADGTELTTDRANVPFEY